MASREGRQWVLILALKAGALVEAVVGIISFFFSIFPGKRDPLEFWKSQLKLLDPLSNVCLLPPFRWSFRLPWNYWWRILSNSRVSLLTYYKVPTSQHVFILLKKKKKLHFPYPWSKNFIYTTKCKLTPYPQFWSKNVTGKSHSCHPNRYRWCLMGNNK